MTVEISGNYSGILLIITAQTTYLIGTSQKHFIDVLNQVIGFMGSPLFSMP